MLYKVFACARHGGTAVVDHSWTDNGQPVAGGTLSWQFHRQFFGCSWSSTEEQVLRVRLQRPVGGRRTTRALLSCAALCRGRFFPLSWSRCCRGADRCHSTIRLMVNRLLEPVYAALILQSLGTALRKRHSLWYEAIRYRAPEFRRFMRRRKGLVSPAERSHTIFLVQFLIIE